MPWLLLRPASLALALHARARAGSTAARGAG
jgi:hypothetical protein